MTTMTKENESFLKINGFEKIESSDLWWALKINEIFLLEVIYDYVDDSFFIVLTDDDSVSVVIESKYKGDLSHFQELVSCFKKYFK